jgi:hypothetical protein
MSAFCRRSTLPEKPSPLQQFPPERNVLFPSKKTLYPRDTENLHKLVLQRNATSYPRPSRHSLLRASSAMSCSAFPPSSTSVSAPPTQHLQSFPPSPSSTSVSAPPTQHLQSFPPSPSSTSFSAPPTQHLQSFPPTPSTDLRRIINNRPTRPTTWKYHAQSPSHGPMSYHRTIRIPPFKEVRSFIQSQNVRFEDRMNDGVTTCGIPFNPSDSPSNVRGFLAFPVPSDRIPVNIVQMMCDQKNSQQGVNGEGARTAIYKTLDAALRHNSSSSHVCVVSVFFNATVYIDYRTYHVNQYFKEFDDYYASYDPAYDIYVLDTGSVYEVTYP